MERSTSSGKDREFGVTVLAGTEMVFQKILSNSRVMVKGRTFLYLHLRTLLTYS